MPGFCPVLAKRLGVCCPEVDLLLVFPNKPVGADAFAVVAVGAGPEAAGCELVAFVESEGKEKAGLGGAALPLVVVAVLSLPSSCPEAGRLASLL